MSPSLPQIGVAAAVGTGSVSTVTLLALTVAPRVPSASTGVTSAVKVPSSV